MSDPQSNDDRSALAKSLGRASEATSVIFTIGICFLAGYGLDRLMDSSPVFALIGLGLGLFTGFWQLLKMAGRITGSTNSGGRDPGADE